ncbi:MAG: hypothetical protein PHW54_01265 [Candidatus Omnitrophica bacterium]|nr:hypothetical protein [Candidatus Omnitrophota bacterium]MDD5356389.1 hypothetical protein [Candidatus Omnitrophota bacterium]
MNETLYRDWPVYVLLGAVVYFFIYVIIKGNLPEKKNKEDQGK